MPWHRHKPSKRAVFVSLMLLAAASLFLLPARWSNSLKHAGQFLVPFEHPAYRIAQGAAASVSDLDPAQNDDTIERDALRHRLTSQNLVAQALRDENARLRSAGRLVGNDASGLPVPILPAKIVARDIIASRDSILVARGSSRGVRHKDWVASRFFVDRGQIHGVTTGQAVLASECLLGHIEQVSPYMARVQLLTDVACPRIEVRIGSLTDNTDPTFVDYPCSLRGLGSGRMTIEDVPCRYVQGFEHDEADQVNRTIRVGDLVLSAPGQLGLPEPLVIGKIAEFIEDPRKRLVVDLVIEPAVSIDQLREVLIIPLIPLDHLPTPE